MYERHSYALKHGESAALNGVEHKYLDFGNKVMIHVADAGPADGPAVMLVHGFPENWWEWLTIAFLQRKGSAGDITDRPDGS